MAEKLTVRRLVSGNNSAHDRIANFQIDKGKLNKYLLDVMKRCGIPSELYDTYEQFCLKKWNNSLASYASIPDFSHPEYQEHVKRQNAMILAIRRGMESTPEGQTKLAEMRDAGHDDGTTIPYPRFDEKKLT